MATVTPRGGSKVRGGELILGEQEREREGGSPLVAMLAIFIGSQACAAFIYMILSMLGCVWK